MQSGTAAKELILNCLILGDFQFLHPARYHVDYSLTDIGDPIGASLQVMGYPDKARGSGNGFRVFGHEREQLVEHLVIKVVNLVVLPNNLLGGTGIAVYQGIHYLGAGCMVLHHHGVFVRVTENRAIRSDYRYSGINLAAEFLCQNIEVTPAVLSGIAGRADFGGYSGFIFQPGTRVIQLVTPDGTGKVRSRDRHAHYNQ